MSLTKFAKAMAVGRNTIIKNENGSRMPKDHEIKRMAELSGLPLEFFTTPDLRAALVGEAPADPAVAPPIWLIVAELSVRLFDLEETALKQRGAAADQADPIAETLRVQDAVRNLQARAIRLSQEARDAAGGTLK